MGIWGRGPTESDGAADWIEGLFDSAGLQSHVLNTLNQPPHDSFAEIRAAAHFVRVLTDEDLWPHATAQPMREVAADRLSAIVEERAINNPVLVRAIENEVRELRGQRGRSR